MSRTYKKTLGFCDRDPWAKRYANRRLRRIPVDQTLANGRAYARYTCPWNICDWKCLYFSEADLRKDCTRWWKMGHRRRWYPECEMSEEEYFQQELRRNRMR